MPRTAKPKPTRPKAKATAKATSARDKTGREIAKLISVTPQVMTDYIKRGCPYDKQAGPRGANLFNLAEVKAWQASQNLTGTGGRPIGSGGGGADINAEKLKQIRLTNRLKELDVQEKEGRLISIEMVRQFLASRSSVAKGKFMGLGAAITPMLEGRDAAYRQGIIDSRVNEILDELAKEHF